MLLLWLCCWCLCLSLIPSLSATQSIPLPFLRFRHSSQSYLLKVQKRSDLAGISQSCHILHVSSCNSFNVFPKRCLKRCHWQLWDLWNYVIADITIFAASSNYIFLSADLSTLAFCRLKGKLFWQLTNPGRNVKLRGAATMIAVNEGQYLQKEEEEDWLGRWVGGLRSNIVDTVLRVLWVLGGWRSNIVTNDSQFRFTDLWPRHHSRLIINVRSYC